MIRHTPAERDGYIERDGVRVHFQLFGAGEEALVLLPTWSIVHSDFWRRQVPHLMKTHRVLVFDGRGNGASDRPPTAAAYADDEFAADALAVMDAAGVGQATLVSVSAGAGWHLILAAEHPDRVRGSVFIGASLPLGEALPERAAALAHFDEEQDSYEGWLKFNRHYWLSDWPSFLEFFFSNCFTEPDSDAEIAHFVGMGLETTPETILLTAEAPSLDRERTVALAERVTSPVLVIHGDADAISSVTRGRELAEHTRGQFIELRGGGHEPQCRWPEQVNRLLDDFLERPR